MLQIVTLPRWECRAPESFSRRGERYWTCAELPLEAGWSFVVKLAANLSRQLPARVVFVVSAEKLLDCLVEVGIDAVLSVHQLSIGTEGDDDQLVSHRITCVEVAEDPAEGWRKVYAFHTTTSRPLMDAGDFDTVPRLQNRVVVARFPWAGSSGNGDRTPS